MQLSAHPQCTLSTNARCPPRCRSPGIRSSPCPSPRPGWRSSFPRGCGCNCAHRTHLAHLPVPWRRHASGSRFRTAQDLRTRLPPPPPGAQDPGPCHQRNMFKYNTVYMLEQHAQIAAHFPARAVFPQRVRKQVCADETKAAGRAGRGGRHAGVRSVAAGAPVRGHRRRLRRDQGCVF